MTSEAGAPPRCSVVVGARLAETSPGPCLDALEPQVGPDVEVLVVDDGGDYEYPPWVRRLSADGALVPELWAVGLAAARGDVVALTTSTVVPDPDWLATVRRLLADGDLAGIGGAIEPGPGLGLVDWAVWFCRYTPYLKPFEARDTVDVPGDNAGYRADVLRQYHHLWRDAFWEPFVHRAMAADGHRLAVTPDLVVHHRGGTTARFFARQRFAHARVYGQLRSEGRPRTEVLRACLQAPAVPLLMTARAARQLARKSRHRERFVATLPLVLWFHSWWAAGELVGRGRVVLGRSATGPG